MQEKIKISIKWIDFIYHNSNSPLHHLIIISSKNTQLAASNL